MTQMLKVEDVASELNLSELEVRRAIAKGQLAAKEISGFDQTKNITKKPDWRITPTALTNFTNTADFTKVRLPNNFLDQEGELRYDSDAQGKVRNAWTEHIRDNQQWDRSFRTTWAQSKWHSPQRISQVVVNYGTSLPDELLELSKKPALGGLAGKLARENKTLDARDPAGFTIAQSLVYNRARRAAASVIQQSYAFGGVGRNAITGIDILYATPEIHKKIIQKVRTKVGDEQLRSGGIEAELKLEDLAPTTLHFTGFADFDIRGLLSSADYIKWVGMAF